MARVQKRRSTSFDNNESPQSYNLGARSCRGCHQRKVRCDRGVPCTNCSRCGITCMYPTKDRDAARKTITLQNISNRLERLEVLLSRFFEGSQATAGSAADLGGGGGESQTQIQVQNCVNVNIIGTANQHSSDQHPCKSTWQLLLNDEQVVQFANHSDIELPLRDVRPDFLDFVQVLLPSLKLSCDKDPRTNMTCPLGTENQNCSTDWVGNSTLASSKENKYSSDSSCAARCSFRHGF